MKTRTLSVVLVALVACKGKDKTTDTTSPPAAGAPAAKTAEAPGGCPAGFTNADNLGVCVKLIDGLKPNPNVGHSGSEKATGWTADGDTSITIKTESYSSSFWHDHVTQMLAGGGFGGSRLDQAKVGGDGVTATFKADDGPMERRIRITKLHNDNIEAECWAEKKVGSTVGPKLDDVLAVCATAVLSN